MQYKGTFDFAEYPTPANPNTLGLSSGVGTSETTGRIVKLSAAEIASPTAAILADTTATYVGPAPNYRRFWSDGVHLRSDSDTFSPQDFGCIGDFDQRAKTGTNDTTGFLAAVQYVVATSTRLELGPYAYLLTSPIEIGLTTAAVRGGFSIVGTGASEDGYGSNITIVGTVSYAMRIRKTAWRNGVIGGFSVTCKVTSGQDYDFQPANSTVFPCAAGVLFEDTNFSAHAFYDMIFRNCERVIDMATPSVGSNGEFCTYHRIRGINCKRFFRMGTATGQAFNHYFQGCYAITYNFMLGADGFAVFEIVGDQGGDGSNISVDEFNMTIVYNDFTGITTCENLKRASLIRDAGCAGVIHISRGRMEGLTTIFENSSSYKDHIHTVENIDFTSMYSGLANPTVIGTANDVRGIHTLRNCKIKVAAVNNNAALNALLYHKSSGFDWSQYNYEGCFMNGYNASTSASVPMKIDWDNSTPTGHVKFQDVMYSKDSDTNNDTTIQLKLFGATYGVNPTTLVITQV